MLLQCKYMELLYGFEYTYVYVEQEIFFPRKLNFNIKWQQALIRVHLNSTSFSLKNKMNAIMKNMFFFYFTVVCINHGGNI